MVWLLRLGSDLSCLLVLRPQDGDLEAEELQVQVFEVLVEDFQAARLDFFVVVDLQLGAQSETAFIAEVSGPKHNMDCVREDRLRLQNDALDETQLFLCWCQPSEPWLSVASSSPTRSLFSSSSLYSTGTSILLCVRLLAVCVSPGHLMQFAAGFEPDGLPNPLLRRQKTREDPAA